MTVTSKELIPSKFVESSQTVQYSATEVTTVIDKFTAVNSGVSTANVSINIVPTGESVGSSNIVTLTRTLIVGEIYTFPEIVGHILESGSAISAIASLASTISIRAE